MGTFDTIEEGKASVLFEETRSGNFVPRSVFVDVDPNSIDEVKMGPEGRLYKSFVSGNSDSANVFSKARYGIGSKLIDLVLESFRKLAEACDKLNGFLFTCGVGGGTGSGLGTSILEKLNPDYPLELKVGFPLYPSDKISNSVLEPYNSVMATKNLIQYSDACVFLDNQALYDICDQ